MIFHNVEEALRTIENISLSHETRQEAYRYLAELDDCEEAKDLVESLESSDAGVRWKAAAILAGMGEKAVSAVLKALMDPKRVGNQLLREGVIHMIHVFDNPALKHQLEPIIKSLKSQAPNIATMWEAYHLLIEIDPSACK